MEHGELRPGSLSEMGDAEVGWGFRSCRASLVSVKSWGVFLLAHRLSCAPTEDSLHPNPKIPRTCGCDLIWKWGLYRDN